MPVRKTIKTDHTAGYTLGIYVLFLGGFLLLVLFGAKIYGDVARGQAESNNRRALLSYVSFSVRNHDHAGAVSVDAGPEGDMLVLTDTFGQRSYSTRIYLSEGELVEEYGRADSLLGSGELLRIGSCESFQIERVSKQCLRVRLDGASILLHLRSGSEGVA